ncbi:polysaccharide deacetylase family protein [Candidatus Woesearchaeota archaeon]|nr:polysaccharide deacetylase family protein [Candidatus Woesearchaeota archaeon]
MVSVCFYFQVHQPERIRKYSVFEVGKSADYFFHQKNREIIERVAKKCYLPANAIILEQLKKHGRLKVAYSFSGVVLEQLEKYVPEAISSFQKLADTGKVEILDETYYHSLAFLYSKKEFFEQVRMHRRKISELFGQKPKVFRNTELTYNNELAATAAEMGYKAVLAEGADHILGWRSPNFVYKPVTADIKLLLKNYRLSDDIAFRFSNHDWKHWPLTAEKFASWVNSINGNGNCVNLFMDYETFGEHQWPSTGIFNFLRAVPGEILKHPDNDFRTPTEIAEFKPVGELDVPFTVSWADVERDLSAWTGNKMQQAALQKIYEMEAAIRGSGSKKLIENWRKLQTSDHFYYMCTKWFNDGDVHKYFNPYDSPYDAFIAYMNIISDIKQKLKPIEEAIPTIMR